jgi:hypothetical protein
MGMGFVMGMFVGGSVTLLHAAMSGGLKGINGMAVKRSAFGRHGGRRMPDSAFVLGCAAAPSAAVIQ